MICINEQQEVFTSINDEIHSKSSKFVEQLKDLGANFAALTGKDITKHGIQANYLYYIVDGGISLSQSDKVTLISCVENKIHY